MAHIFVAKKKIYSVSDKNRYGEFVVLQCTMQNLQATNPNDINVEDARIIPARNEKQVERLVRANNFSNFKTLPIEDQLKGLH